MLHCILWIYFKPAEPELLIIFTIPTQAYIYCTYIYSCTCQRFPIHDNILQLRSVKLIREVKSTKFSFNLFISYVYWCLIVCLQECLCVCLVCPLHFSCLSHYLHRSISILLSVISVCSAVLSCKAGH